MCETAGRLGRTRTVALNGVDAHLVTVEANIGPGLPGVHVVGMGDTAVRESRDRIRTAVTNSGLDWPRTKIVVSMSPADLPKAGSQFDLAMALAVLSGAERGRGERRLREAMVIGEIGLDGTVREVPGALPAALVARSHGLDTVIVPPGNAAEASVLASVEVLVAPTLADAWDWACGRAELPRAGRPGGPGAASGTGPGGLGDLRAGRAARVPDLADVAGQPEARLALEVAAAGGHHMMMVGPPGSGKSMLAERLPGILPPLTEREMIEATVVHSVAAATGAGPVTHPPFIAPHHTVTRAALLGGGAGHLRPGAVSLAHRGVLFLDEVSEVPAAVLDGLRQPLETGEVHLLRSRSRVTLPAGFQLVLAANPCRCGAAEPAACRCSPAERARYLSNLSGPLCDRLDIFVRTRATGTLSAPTGESSAAVAGRVAAARERAAARWAGTGSAGPEWAGRRVPGPVLRRRFPATEEAMALLEAFLAEGSVSQRGVDRTLRLAWTLADLEEVARPGLDHVHRAVALHAPGADLQEAA
ncbi:YifB family Mg chelatase-like AAA ATPase [Corynebacterium frankenforstense]